MIKKVLVSFLCLSVSAFALDNSYNTSKNLNVNKDKQISNSKSITINKNKTKSKTISKNKNLSKTETQTYTRLEQLDTLTTLLVLEYSNVQPFVGCRVLSKPKLPRDLGLSCVNEDGMVNEGKCSYLKEAAQNNYPLSEVVDQEDIRKIKSYMACVGLYGALIAQNMKGENGFVLKDQELKSIYKTFTNQLKNAECRLIGADTIACGSAMIKLSFTPVLEFSNINLYSSKEVYRYTSNVQNSKSKSISKNISMQVAISKSKAINLAKNINNSTAVHMQLQQQANHNLSLTSFLPKE